MRSMIIALASAAVLSTSAYAQTATSTMAVKDVYVTAKPTDVLSSNLKDVNVTNTANEKIGEIQDVVMSNGQVSGYILSVGGFLGMGEHYVVVSPAALKVTYNENDKKWLATMDATKDQLKAAPQFKYEGRWKR